ncbi:recombinase RecT [Bacteroidota bacterium]
MNNKKTNNKMAGAATASRNRQTSDKLTQEQLNRRTFRDLLERHKNQLTVALPKHLTVERLIRTALTAVSRSPKLLLCDPVTLLGAAIQASEIGLEVGVLDKAYFIPFYNSRTKRYEAQFIAGYKGLAELVQNTGEIQTLQARAVRENDDFDYEFGSKGYLKHKPYLGNRGEIIGFYSYVQTKNGGEYYEIWSLKDMENFREKYARSKDRNGNIIGVWEDEFEKMGCKTMIKQIIKLLPKSTERKVEHDRLQKAVALDDLASSGIPQGLSIDNVDEDGKLIINEDYSGEANEANSEEVKEEKKPELNVSDGTRELLKEISGINSIELINIFKKDKKEVLKSLVGPDAEAVKNAMAEVEDGILNSKKGSS